MANPGSEKQDGAARTNGGTEALVTEKEPSSSRSIDAVPVHRKVLSSSESNYSADSARHAIREADSHHVAINDGEKEDPLGHLPPVEAEIIRRQLHMPKVELNYFSLFRFATRNDQIIMALSSTAAVIGGAVMPLMTIIFGELAGVFQKFMLGTISGAGLQSELNKYTVYFVYLGISEFVMIYVATVGFIYTGEHISQKVREQYLAAILRQNIAFFDELGAGEITTRISADTNLIQDGISEKIGLTITALSTFATAFAIGFAKSWKLTLILMSTVVAVTMVMGFGSTFMMKYNKKSLAAYALGGTIVEEVFSSIRNTTAFNTQDKLAKMYDEHLKVAEKWGLKMKAALAFILGFMMCVIYLNYGLAFWQGSRFLVSGDMTMATVLIVLLAIMIGAFSLGNVAPNGQAFTTAVAAASKIYSTIDRMSPLNPETDEGDVLDHVEGIIELRNVKHIYPSRPNVTVIENMNLVVPAGKVTALVGASGSGKSTIVGLVERFYDPVGGEVLLDGHEIKKLNLRWLRENISLVSQEPVLFGTTIYGNVCHGLIGTKWENVSEGEKRELVTKACVMSNADGFIRSLPEGYETDVGERGFLLSGGQKQRIAIARAIVSDPKILLLDEATSALDTRSEGVVQAALDKASMGRTTIVIAHRLSTIKTADNIVVMSNGTIIESGTHSELLSRAGAYYSLVEAQRVSAENEEKAIRIDGTPEDEDERLRLTLSQSRTKSKKGSFVDLDDVRKLTRLGTTKSKSSIVLENRASEDKPNYSLWELIKMTASFNRTEKWQMLVGLFFCIIAGGGYPTQAVFFAKSIVAIARPPSEYNELRKEANFWAGMYLMLALVQLIAYAGQGLALSYCSEKLIHRARDRAFRALMRQDISFFDKKENSTGALTGFLSTETTHLSGMSGVTLGTLLIVTTTLVAAVSVGCAIGWKLGLACTATIPVLLACGFYRFWMLAKFQRRSKKVYEHSASFACEATAAIRTVASLTREKDVWAHYHRELEIQGKKSLISVLKSSTLYAASQSLMFLCLALGFWYGGNLIKEGEYDMLKFFLVFTAIVFGAQSAGTIFSFAPDMGKARQAASDLKTLFDRKPEIDTWSTEGEEVGQIEGTIEFRDVHFRYPTRSEQPVLRGLDLVVKPGQYVALVGPSGCGKSTTISLIERFYNPVTGGVFVDGREISTLKLNEYRSHLALVSQEPTLYQGTIRENILMGGDREISDEEVIAVCKDANIYDFIMSLPEAFNTICGSKGTLLSGGQKQRIAIARALIRNPKILLLDEATSALDSESEKVVQQALDTAAKGRTTISVAHRLSTIKNADRIYVFDNGRVSESGTHAELMAQRGKYYELVNLQSLGKNT